MPLGAKISKENQKSNTNLKGTFILTIFENLNAGKNRELQVVHRELQGLETYEKIVNCKFVNYETVNYEDPLYLELSVQKIFPKVGY